MAGDNSDPDILETLASIPKHVVNYSIELTEAFERGCDDLGLLLRETLSSSTWLPAAARPKPTPQTLAPIRIPFPPQTYTTRLYNLVFEYKATITAITAFFATGVFIHYQQQRDYLHKRRARRAQNGAKQEVIIIAGSLGSPVPRSVALDLERRGFIVHVVVNTAAEEELVRKEGKKDLQPMHLDITNPFDVQNTLEHLETTFVNGVQFSSFILIPDSVFTPGPIETVSPEIFADTFNTRLVHSIATTQAFLPLIIEKRSRVLVLTPAITSSLRLPFHSLESTTVAGLDAFIQTLTAEMRTLSVDVSHVKLGNLNLEQFGRSLVLRNGSNETLAWPTAMRSRYGQTYMAMTNGQSNTRGSPIRELHNTVFDAITGKRSPRGVLYAGRGAFLYPAFGSWMPQSLVAWMFGYRLRS